MIKRWLTKAIEPFRSTDRGARPSAVRLRRLEDRLTRRRGLGYKLPRVFFLALPPVPALAIAGNTFMNRLLPFRFGSGECCFDVSDLLLEVVESLDQQALGRGVRVEVDAPPYVMVHADQGRMRLVFEHLLSAALGGSLAGGEVLVTTYHEQAMVEVEIAVSGGNGNSADTRHWLTEAHRLLSAERAVLKIWRRSGGELAYLVQLPRPGRADNDVCEAA